MGEQTSKDGMAGEARPSSTRYDLVRAIARGGMATVFEGRHRLTGRRVAVKAVRRSPGSKLEARLLREARILGELRHPSIVDVTDFEETPGHLLMITELLEGRTLEGLLAARGKLTAPQVSAIIMQVAHALALAHDKGVVHRDVKPANLFVIRDSGTDRVKLLDFGAAGHVADRGEQRLTEQGTFLGTFAYTPPEQLEHAEIVDPRSDQYALGMVAFEALAGDLLRLPDRLKAGPSLDLLRATTSAPEPMLSVVARLLEPSAADRFGSLREPLAQLARAPLTPLDLLEPASPRGSASARKHARAPFITPARLRYEGHVFDGRTENISERGLMLLLPTCDVAPEVGKQAQVRFAMPVSGRQIEVPATLRWAREANERKAIGLELDELPHELPGEVASYLRFFGVDA